MISKNMRLNIDKKTDLYSFDKIPQEILLLLGCINFSNTKQALELTQKVQLLKVDWPKFEALCSQHKLQAIVFQGLKTIKPDIPTGIYSRFRQQSIAVGQNSLVYLSLFKTILTTFNQHNIFVMPLKGLFLSQIAYNDMALRNTADIDLLVKKSDVLGAVEQIKIIGFEIQFDLDSKQLLKYIKTEDHITFYSSRSHLVIELHWELSGRYLTRPISLMSIQKFIIYKRIYEIHYPYMNDECLFVYLCIHGAKHKWDNLEQIFCIARLISIKKSLCWKTVAKMASMWRCRLVVSLGIMLAQKIFHVSVAVDPSLIKKCEKTKLLKIQDRIIKDLLEEPFNNFEQYANGRFNRIHLAMKDTITDKIVHCLRLIFEPTEKEWQYFPLNANCSFFHYLLRPFRLARLLIRDNHE